MVALYLIVRPDCAVARPPPRGVPRGPHPASAASSILIFLAGVSEIIEWAAGRGAGFSLEGEKRRNSQCKYTKEQTAQMGRNEPFAQKQKKKY